MNKNDNWYKTEYQKDTINSNSWFDINVIENKNYSAIHKYVNANNIFVSIAKFILSECKINSS